MYDNILFNRNSQWYDIHIITKEFIMTKQHEVHGREMFADMQYNDLHDLYVNKNFLVCGDQLNQKK